MQTHAIVLIGALVGGACGYEASFRNCAVACAAENDCPAGLGCLDGLCVEPGTSSCADIEQPDARPMDAPDPTCVCTTQETLTCASGETTCALGCTNAIGGASCNSFVPSNGANDQHLVGVTSALVLAAGDQVRIDTSTGEIKQGASIVRPAGIGVVAGIGFYSLDDANAVFAVTSIEIGSGAQLRGRGSRGLILLSAGEVTIGGVIDVSAGCENGGGKHCAGPGGTDGSIEGTTSEGCGAAGDSVRGSLGHRFGAGGGGYGEPGSAPDCSPDQGSGIPGSPGASCGSSELDPLHGGFGGGFADSDTAGGGGGGAIQVTSKTAIRFIGTTVPVGIRAGGAGGEGDSNTQGSSNHCAGGGGSGGAIVLEAPTLLFTSKTVLAANGGGGGGDCLGNGNPIGEDGRFDAQPAGGSVCGGGKGGSRTSPATDPEFCDGGGGGGVGRIRINSVPAGTSGQGVTFSPEPTFGFITASGG